jgi:N-acetylglucosamine-6-phosphate deacetylase
VDVHVHGVDGSDTLDEGDALARIAASLPRYGVTSFCPTTVACPPDALRRVLDSVKTARSARDGRSARVLPAHLESNFINPDFCGAQPIGCLRTPAQPARADGQQAFSGRDILDVIATYRADVGIVTLAPEIAGGLDLVRMLTSAGHRVSLGHSGADFETATAAIEAGARHATHLFNRMPPLGHRAPGLAGAVLGREEVAAELIFDGYHVHPAMGRLTIAAKGVAGVMAISDGTAGSGLPIGSVARLGGRPIQVREHAAVLDDGTLAGSTLTLDGAFRMIVGRLGCSVVDAAAMCSTTPARQLGLTGLGLIAEGALGDLVVLDRDLRVRRTFIDGREVHTSG